MGIRFGHISDMHLEGDAASDSLVRLKAAGGDPLGNTRLALEELDGTDELSLLTQALTGINKPPSAMDAKAYCNFRDGIRRSLSPLDRAHIASFARTVYDTAKRGDKKSIALYQRAGIDMAKLVITAARKAQAALSCVVVNGGMVNGKEFWQESFEETLKNEYGAIKVQYLTDGIDRAMCHMAKRMIKGE
jgi:N-acetylglucosamine kinase-like BadF-type ATPase